MFWQNTQRVTHVSFLTIEALNQASLFLRKLYLSGEIVRRIINEARQTKSKLLIAVVTCEPHARVLKCLLSLKR